MPNNKVVLVLNNGDRVEIPGLKIDFFDKNNLVEVYEGAVFHNTHLKLRKNCKVVINKSHPRGIRNTVVDMAGNTNSSLYIGKNTSIESARFAMANDDNLKIDIGENCMLSSNIVFRATDGHVVYDINDKEIPINNSKPIYIGNHVWIGSGVTILKGSIVLDNSIIGTMSLVSNQYDKENVAIGGNPAKIIKTNVNWDRTYIKNWSI